MANTQDNKRNFKNRGLGRFDEALNQYVVDSDKSLSTKLPKPNILRIEVLDGNARQRYLGAVQRIGDNIKTRTYQRMTQDGERVFFGFLTEGADSQFDLKVTWDDKSPDGVILGQLKSIAENVPGIAGDVTQAITNITAGIGNIAGSLTGINASTTGSGTIKNFSGVSLNDYSITCGWYLPEQYSLCIKSLKTLYRMAYPRQLSNFSAKQFINDFSTEFRNRDNQIFSGDILGAVENFSNNTVSFVTDVANETGAPETLFEIYKQFREGLGGNFVFNPLPVRVSVAQHMDIEPLVITGVNTKFSKETFINYSGTSDQIGRHLPIFVTTTISLKYWLNPAPKLEFTNILGQELFGEKHIPDESKIPKEDSTSYANRIGGNQSISDFDSTSRSNRFGGLASDSVSGLR